jgi:hypothetical protein
VILREELQWTVKELNDLILRELETAPTVLSRVALFEYLSEMPGE